MNKQHTPFIVLEGLDGSGTTTQTNLLASHLRSAGVEVYSTYEPTDGPAGKLIRDVLSGKLFAHRSDEKIVFSERTLCLLFAADRLDHTTRIEEARRSGAVTVCDRYILSSLAYQTLDPAISPEWVIEVNRGCALPDLTIFLQVPPAVCTRRLRARHELPTLYEKEATLAAIDANYTAMLAAYQERFGPVVTFDGTSEPEVILDQITDAITPLLSI